MLREQLTATQSSIAQARQWQGMAMLATNARDAQGLSLITEGTERIEHALVIDPFDANMQRMLAEQRVQARGALRRGDALRACALFAKANEAFSMLKSEQRLSEIFTQISVYAFARAAECAAGQ